MCEGARWPTPPSVDDLDAGAALARRPGARCAYYVDDKLHNTALFANGQVWQVSTAFAQFICQHQTFTVEDIQSSLQNPTDRAVLIELVATGVLALG